MITPPLTQGASVPAIQVEGNSGCKIEISNAGGRLIVRKSARAPNYSDRLRLQIDKQQQFLKTNTLEGVHTADVLNTGQDGHCFFAEMTYLPYVDSIEFFSMASKVMIDRVVDQIFGLIDCEIAESPQQAVSSDVFVAKIQSVADRLRELGRYGVYEKSLSDLIEAFTKLGELSIPVGRSHGDLTFSNIMFAPDGQRIGLIDFLDGFIESPVMDVAKLRQDTRCNWTIQMYKGGADVVRYREVMRYIEARVQGRFKKYPWFQPTCDCMLGMCLIRIAPYAQSEEIHKYILTSLSSLRYQ